MPRLELSRAEERDKKSAAAGSTATPQSAIGKSKRKLNDPIIIVSPSSTALINMYNVKQFLERSTSVCARWCRLSPRGADADRTMISLFRLPTASSRQKSLVHLVTMRLESLCTSGINAPQPRRLIPGRERRAKLATLSWIA